MKSSAILRKLNKFCPEWISRPDKTMSIPQMMEYVIKQVLPGLLKVKVQFIDEDKIIGLAPYQNKTANVLGYMHGGAIFSLGDTLAGALIWAITDEDTIAVTVSSKIEYLKPVKDGGIKCTVILKSKTGKQAVLYGVFHDDNNQIVSKMAMNYHLMSA